MRLVSCFKSQGRDKSLFFGNPKRRHSIFDRKEPTGQIPRRSGFKKGSRGRIARPDLPDQRFKQQNSSELSQALCQNRRASNRLQPQKSRVTSHDSIQTISWGGGGTQVVTRTGFQMASRKTKEAERSGHRVAEAGSQTLGAQERGAAQRPDHGADCPGRISLQKLLAVTLDKQVNLSVLRRQRHFGGLF